jgi:hypothetical protein
MVLRTEGTDGVVSVDYTTVDQTAHAPADYEHRAGTLTFAEGERLKEIEIPIVNNPIYTGLRTFRVDFSNGETLTVQIADDDDPQIPSITVDDTAAVEDGAAQFAVHLSQPSLTAVSFMATTVAGTATAGFDFEEGTQTVTIPAGQTSATITVPLVDDVFDKPDEAFTLELTNSASAYLATVSVEGVIEDNDEPLPQLLVGNVRVSESAGFAVFTVKLASPIAGAIEVAFETLSGTATPGNDFTYSLNTVTFAPGEVSKTITIPLMNDHAAERDETFRLRVSIEGSSEPGTMATCTIVNDDGGRGRAGIRRRRANRKVIRRPCLEPGRGGIEIALSPRKVGKRVPSFSSPVGTTSHPSQDMRCRPYRG